MSLTTWALPRLSQLLPLDEDSLKQVITYTDTLPREAAADHLKNLLGDSAQALEFISSFNARRPTPPSETPSIAGHNTSRDSPSSRNVSDTDQVPRSAGRQKKKKQPFNKLPTPRQVEGSDHVSGGYMKQNELDYMAPKGRTTKEAKLSNTLALQAEPDAVQEPHVRAPEVQVTSASPSSTPRSGTPVSTDPTRPAKPQPKPAGHLISSLPPSRSSTPPNSTQSQSRKSKVNLTGGTPMHGASTILEDLDSAIRTLEIQTNPSLASHSSSDDDRKKRRCNCMAQRHALLAAAPNCVSCGKIICVKEGLGPCTFCGMPLLSQAEVQGMLRTLKDERGRERMEANNTSHKRAEVSKAPRPFASPSNSGVNTPAAASDSETEGLAAAKAHRDKLLNFQAQNARRTQVHDEAADFETPDTGLSMWATPQERALQLKKQQKVLREQAWNARPEYEKRRMVVSLDVKGGKAVRKMANVEKPSFSDVDEDQDEDLNVPSSNVANGEGHGGAFSRNPLLGGLIRPVIKIDKKGKGKATGDDTNLDTPQYSRWRRVQDDDDDNERWILDGGAYGDRTDGRVLGAEEHACG